MRACNGDLGLRHLYYKKDLKIGLEKLKDVMVRSKSRYAIKLHYTLNKQLHEHPVIVSHFRPNIASTGVAVPNANTWHASVLCCADIPARFA